MRRTFYFPAIASLIGILAPVVTAEAQMTDEQIARYFGFDEPKVEWLRHFRLGAAVAVNVKADFSSGSQFTVPGVNAGATGVGGENHVYDDGFVKVDVTGNGEGLTWNWGYQNASQAQTPGRLFFHATDSYTAFPSSGSADCDAQVGLELAYGGAITRVGSGLLGWEFGFTWLPLEVEHRFTSPATVSRTIHSYGYTFEQLPGAPYRGTFNGPGATIQDIAQFEGNDTQDGTLTSKQTLDVSLYAFRLGPTLHWELHPRIAVAVSAGGAFGIVAGDLDFDDTIVLDGGQGTVRFRGGTGSTEFVYGGYVGGTLMYHAVPNGDFYIGFQYMPLTSATFSGGGREAELDLSGSLYFTAGLNWPF